MTEKTAGHHAVLGSEILLKEAKKKDLAWSEYQAELRQALASLPHDVLEAKVKLAYHRYYGLPVSEDLFSAATDSEPEISIERGTVGAEIL